MLKRPPTRSSRRTRVPSSFARNFNVMSQRTREIKYKENVVASSVSTTPSLALLTQIAQGATDTTRNGDQVDLHRVDIRISAAIDGTVAPDNYNVVRVILFQWHPQSGISTLPATTDILQNATQPQLSSYNHDTRWEYTILRDHTFSLSMEGSRVQTIRWNFPRMTHKLQFSGGTTDGTNHLYLLMVSDSGTVDHPSVIFNSKVTFYDS